MAIIVEDGTGVSGANSYLNLIDAIARTENLGYPAPDMTEEQLIQGMQETHKYAKQFKGCRTYPAIQSTLADWPRTGAYVYDQLVVSGSIPEQLLDAQAVGAAFVSAGAEPFGVSDGKQIASEESCCTKTSYFNNGSTSNDEMISIVYELLEPLLKCASGSLVLMR